MSQPPVPSQPPAASAAQVVAIDVGGTKVSAALVDTAGRISANVRADTPSHDGAALTELIASLPQKVAQAAGLADLSGVAGVGIGSAGVVAADGRSIVSATDAIRGWAGQQVVARLEEVSGLPGFMCNDVHAHALGEVWLGAGRGSESVLLAAAGTGLGGAFFTRRDGLWRGERGLAGHFGHLPVPFTTQRTCSCGRQVSHLESFASGPGLVGDYHELGGDLRITSAKALEELANAGDELAQRAYRRSGEALGAALAGLVNAFDPQVVIVGGGLARSGKCWWDPLEAAFRGGLMDLVRDIELHPAHLGNEAALAGGAYLAFRNLGLEGTLESAASQER